MSIQVTNDITPFLQLNRNGKSERSEDLQKGLLRSWYGTV
jgi:hypothetical protein